MEIDQKYTDINSAVEQYDQRYSSGYQDKADSVKVKCLRQLFSELSLPEHGKILDFGGGSGAYTEILAELLPGWEIFCADISPMALVRCKARLPQVTCLSVQELQDKKLFFDFIFSHHVLEHVQDLPETFKLFSDISKDRACMVHVLPCGDAGSFEYKVCLMIKDSIDHKQGNRFFYEDKSHLRRLTSAELNQIANEIGYSNIVTRFSNNFYGALIWIAQADTAFFSELFAYKKATNKFNAIKLFVFKVLFYWLSLVFKVRNFSRKAALSTRRKMIKVFLYLCLAAPISQVICSYIEHKADGEFANSTLKKAGSEMFAVYKR